MKKNYFNYFFGIFTLLVITAVNGQNCTPPTATITPSGAATICNAAEGLILKATEGEGLTYQWKKNGTNIADATSQTYAAKETGGYSVTVSSGASCSATSTPTFVQQSQPNGLRINVNPKTVTTCGTDSATLRVNPGMGTYQWYNLSGPIANATSASYKTNTVGQYFVKVQMQGGCPTSSDTATVSAGEAPAKPTIVMDGDSLVSSVASSYQWLFNDNAIPNSNKQKIRPMGPGTYKVRVGTQSCSTTSDAYDFLITATEEMTLLTGTTVYPSPFNDAIYVNSNTTTDLKIGFYNNLGVLVFETTTKSNAEILVRDIPTGLYTVKVQSGTASYFTKLIKQ